VDDINSVKITFSQLFITFYGFFLFLRNEYKKLKRKKGWNKSLSEQWKSLMSDVEFSDEQEDIFIDYLKEEDDEDDDNNSEDLNSDDLSDVDEVDEYSNDSQIKYINDLKEENVDNNKEINIFSSSYSFRKLKRKEKEKENYLKYCEEFFFSLKCFIKHLDNPLLYSLSSKSDITFHSLNSPKNSDDFEPTLSTLSNFLGSLGMFLFLVMCFIFLL
jgi:hypothetical protein